MRQYYASIDGGPMETLLMPGLKASGDSKALAITEGDFHSAPLQDLHTMHVHYTSTTEAVMKYCKFPDKYESYSTDVHRQTRKEPSKFLVIDMQEYGSFRDTSADDLAFTVINYHKEAILSSQVIIFWVKETHMFRKRLWFKRFLLSANKYRSLFMVAANAAKPKTPLEKPKKKKQDGKKKEQKPKQKKEEGVKKKDVQTKKRTETDAEETTDFENTNWVSDSV